MMRNTCWFVLLAFLIPSASTAYQAHTGTIVSENSVDCGAKGNKKKQMDLVCQEYVVHTATTEYHIRQEKQKDQNLLPLNVPVEFAIDKDKMKLKANGKKYEFLIVSETGIAQSKQ